MMRSFKRKSIAIREKRAVRAKTGAMLALILAAGLMAACGVKSADNVIMAGSTSVQPYAEILSEDYALLHPDVAIEVQGGGSAAGITAAESGAADIGMSSRGLKDDEKQALWSVQIALDGIAIIVNPQNPVKSLTSEQVRGIYDMSIANWSELGGRDAKIHIVTREDGSGTRTSFESLIMGRERITPKAIVQDSNGAVKQLVGQDPDSIGFISLGLVDETVKDVVLDGVQPTRENVLNGTYGLYRPFLFLSKGEPAGLAKQFIDFTLSPDGQKILSDEGLISTAEGTKK